MVADGKSCGTGTFSATNRSSGSLELDVPVDKDFNIEVVKYTTINYKYGGRDVSINFGENEKTVKEFNNTPPDLKASFNQVTGEMRLQWDVDDEVSQEG